MRGKRCQIEVVTQFLYKRPEATSRHRVLHDIWYLFSVTLFLSNE